MTRVPPLLCAMAAAAALLPALAAQDAGAVEGRVTNSTTHQGIAGVTVAVASQRATTDSSGTFRLADLPLGEQTVTCEAPGFFKTISKFRLYSRAAIRLDVELTPHSSIIGRVLDEEGNALPGVRVEITQAVRGTGTTWTVWNAITDDEGRYRKDPMPPGAYLAMARPNPQTSLFAKPTDRLRTVPPPKALDGRRAWVRTYHPSAPDRGQAGRLVLRGGTQVAADIRLRAVPVYAIRGLVYDPGGQPARASVSLLPAEAMELPEARVETSEGAFAFPDAPSGEWRVVAETGGAGVKLRGVGPALLSRHELDNVAIHLAAPFVLRGVVEPRGKETPRNIELYPADSPSSGAAHSQPAPDGSLHFPAVSPGRYRINVFGGIAGHYLDSVVIGEQDVLGKDVVLAEGMPPVRIVFKPNAASVRGTVEKCAGASVILLPQDEGLWDFRFIRQASCDSAGHFEIGGLRPGDYYALALDHVDSTGLDDLSILRRLAGMASEVAAGPRRAAYIELKPLPWPE